MSKRVESLRVKLLVFLEIGSAHADIDNILRDVKKHKELEHLIVDLVNLVSMRGDQACVAVLCDPVYLNIFEGALFDKLYTVPFVFIVVAEHEDLLSPNFSTLEAMRHARKEGCGAYFIILANGLQASRLLTFGDRYRLLDTRAKYIMLHDIRLFKSSLHYLWKRIVNIVFLRYHNAPRNKTWFDLSTVPFPNTIREVLITRRIEIWRNGKFHYNTDLFADKTKNLYGETLSVVYLEHVPSVVNTKSNETKKVGGVEIEILNTIASKMNFKLKLYQSTDAEQNKWGQKLPNGSYSGLLGEMVTGQADIAVGNLQYTTLYLEMTDLSIPYTSQCWTFLTPEAMSDNSWKTLILPFKLYMWIAVLMVLLVTGSIFYGLAKYYIHLMDFRGKTAKDRSTEKIKQNLTLDTRAGGLYLFGEITNSILYTYGMLLVVSLPKLPSGWSIRLLTGWYWLYCILLVVSYKASMTAILANPTPRVTIDTLKELVDSKITCGGWGQETKKFFLESLDDVGQKIGQRFEIINDPDAAVKRVVRGDFAYYDNKNFLKYLRVKRKNNKIDINTTNLLVTNDTNMGNTRMERNLHIMSDCMVNIPVSIGFHKNSPLKPLADVYLRRIVEVGLFEKWSNDAMYRINTLDTNDEEIKALMNLKKLQGAFIALAIGYFISLVIFISELSHWHFIVKKDPHFDKYAMDLYYINKNKKH
ncbi:Glutamate receptor, ionotropic kainate 1 [Papilio xuthus]|uniref:Glutamate receptor, ionotropic kainate 1 n=1 Tax=Papilio xuthus TaxID=66420 RepID=A0A194QNB4_PAPXU|nr:Glutamate receptor, ionotropic kainate 1 [Papilio xuthus]